MSQADAIRTVLGWPITRFNAAEHADALAALDALVAENQRLKAENERLRGLVGAYVTEGLRSQPDQEAIDAAAAGLVREAYGTGTASTGKPSAAQTLEDTQTTKEKAGS